MGDLPRIAVVDLGTNTFNLLIAEKRPSGGFSVLREETKESKLGRKGGLKGCLAEDAIQDALALLKEYDAIAKDFNVNRYFALGTSALRQATNTYQLSELVQLHTDFKLIVVSGTQEASLIHQGIVAAGVLNQKRLILDIGGGSCEFIVAEDEHVFWKKSFEIGMVRASELGLSDSDFQTQSLSKLIDYFLPALQEVEKVVINHCPQDLIGAAGSFDTLSALHAVKHHRLFKKSYQAYEISFPEFQEISAKIMMDSVEKRLLYPHMIPVRAPLLPYALTLIQQVLALFPQECSLICTSYALREGVAKLVFENNWD